MSTIFAHLPQRQNHCFYKFYLPPYAVAYSIILQYFSAVTGAKIERFHRPGHYTINRLKFSEKISKRGQSLGYYVFSVFSWVGPRWDLEFNKVPSDIQVGFT